MQFRGTRDDTERLSIKEEYARTVKKLINSKNWNEIPPLEDQLPDEDMPEEFFQYWSLTLPTRATG